MFQWIRSGLFGRPHTLVPPPQTAAELYNLAFSHARQSKWAQATEAYQSAYARDPDYRTCGADLLAPVYVQIETVRACNAACTMCPLETSPTPRRNMSDETFDLVVQRIAEMPSIPALSVFGLGEPLMDKKIVRRVRALNQLKPPTINLVSNGALMTKADAESLIDAGVTYVVFSIESVDAATFEAIRLNLKLSETLTGIRSFIDARNRMAPNLPIRLAFTYSRENIHQYEQFRAYWLPLLKEGIDCISLIPVHSFGKFSLYSTDNHGPCYQMFTDMHIRADGVVSLCCIDVESEYRIGDIRHHSLTDIYNCDQIKEDRHRHLLGRRHEMKLCAECDQPEAVLYAVNDALVGSPPQLDASGRYFLTQ